MMVAASWSGGFLRWRLSQRPSSLTGLVTMRVHRVQWLLTFNTEDFKRSVGIQVINPGEISRG